MPTTPTTGPEPVPAEASVDELVDVVAHNQITRLQHAYADLVNRRAWGELPLLFEPDAAIHLDLVSSPVRHLTGPEAFAEFVGPAMARFDFFEFVILNSHIELWPDGDRAAAIARVFMCELRRDEPDTTGAPGPASQTFGLYRDRYRRADGCWRFAERHYRTLAREPDGVVFPLPALEAR